MPYGVILGKLLGSSRDRGTNIVAAHVVRGDVGIQYARFRPVHGGIGIADEGTKERNKESAPHTIDDTGFPGSPRMTMRPSCPSSAAFPVASRCARTPVACRGG